MVVGVGVVVVATEGGGVRRGWEQVVTWRGRRREEGVGEEKGRENLRMGLRGEIEEGFVRKEEEGEALVVVAAAMFDMQK